MNAEIENARRYPAVVLRDKSSRARRRMRLSLAIGVSVWLYVLGVLVVWLLLRLAGERWWLATIMLFGPRWVYGAPLVLLIPAAAMLRRRLLWPLAVAAVVVVWPIMGLCLPWGRVVAPDGPMLRVLTFNVAGEATTPDALLKLIETFQPDVVALEESCAAEFYGWPKEWQVLQHGELLVASRYPMYEIPEIDHVYPGQVSLRWTLLQCVISTPDGDVDFCCIHLPSPRSGIATVLDQSTVLAPSRSGMVDEGTRKRRRQADEAARWVEGKSASVILAGDFNMTTDGSIYRGAWGRYRNAFSTSGSGFGNTIRAGTHGWQFGARIDHILTGSHWWPRRCWVGPDIGSDHLPLIADLVWSPDGD
jgi:endonuclease/exonuclease/phosphatase (EEP) superfamily protein YafD